MTTALPTWMSAPQEPEKEYVNSHGYEGATIFFLGGHPLSEDIRQGLALSGHLEKTLDKFLRQQNSSIKECYRSLFIKEKLSFSGTTNWRLKEALIELGEEDRKKYERILYEEIKEVDPIVIVPLDDLALGAVFPHINDIKLPKGRKHWTYCYRGSILPLREDWQVELPHKIKIIPTISPQMLFQDNLANYYVPLDYEKIIKETHTRAFPDTEGLCWVAKTSGDVANFFNRQYEKRPTRVTFDIETFYGFIVCISFCFDGYEAMTIPMLMPDMPKADLVAIYKMLQRVFGDPNLEKNNHNIKYDWTILERHGFRLVNVTSDSLLKGGLLYPELLKGLDFYTSIFTKIPYYKDEGKEFDPRLHSKDRLYLYCAKDSLASHQIAREEDAELEEEGIKDLYETEVAPLILIYKNIDQTGLWTDGARKEVLLDKYAGLYNTNLDFLRELANNKELNPSSNPQIGKLVYEDLGYPKRQKTDPETGKVTYKTDKDTLDELLIQFGENGRSGKIGYKILSRTIMCRKIRKVMEFIQTPLTPDGRLIGSYNIGGTETGRTSCSRSIDEVFIPDRIGKAGKLTKKVGRSLQTISKHGFTVDEEVFDEFEDEKIADDLRSMFVAPRDYFLIEGDGAGAEARVVFVMAEDYEALESMDKKPKIHAKTAALIFNIPAESITSESPRIPKIGVAYYDMGKRIRHAGHYDMGAFRLAQMCHLSLKECQSMLDKFHGGNPRIRSVFHQEVIDVINNTRRLVTPFGRRRDFFAKLDEKLYKEAFAYIPQSVIGDLTKFTMRRIIEVLPGYMQQYKFVVESHDGLLSYVHKDIKDRYMDVFKEKYERDIDFNQCSLSRDFKLRVPVEISISGSHWGDLKRVI